MNAIVKPKKCKVCRTEFIPRNSLQMTDKPACAITYSRLRGEGRQSLAMKRAAALERREQRAALKTVRDWIREAQPVFNAWIRERDYFEPCISCGVRNLTIAHGGAWDAGHFRTVGACPELRFEPLNVHKQCKSCNSGVKRTGVRIIVALDAERYTSIRAAYRKGLIAKIGLKSVEWLEGPHGTKHYTTTQLQEMIRDWRIKTSELRAARDSRGV